MNIFKCVLPLFVVFFFISCDNTDSFTTSSSFIQSGIKVIDIDSFQTKMSTYRYDSLASGSSRMLVGQYTDPIFGEVTASSNIELTPTYYYYSIDEGAVFDSVVISLPYDGYRYGDTLLSKTIRVQKLLKEVRLPNSQADFYNTTVIPADGQPLGETTFFPRIGRDSLTIALSPAFGQTIFTALRNNNVSNREEFLDYLKGIRLSPSASENASIIGFDPAGTYIRLYYSMPDQPEEEGEYIDLKYNSSGKRCFNNIAVNPQNTALQLVGGGQENETASAALQNRSFIHSGIGVMTKVTFPSIRNIWDVNEGNGQIFKAELKVKLDNRYYNRNYPLADSLYVCTVDQNNDIIAYDGVAYIKRDDPELNEVYLTADVNFFIKKVISDSRYLDYGLIFVPFNYTSSIDRYVLNGEDNVNYRSKLKLTYLIYD